VCRAVIIRGTNYKYIVLLYGRSLLVAVGSGGIRANRDSDRRLGPSDRSRKALRKQEIMGLLVV
jgi:hypothetical protein